MFFLLGFIKQPLHRGRLKKSWTPEKRERERKILFAGNKALSITLKMIFVSSHFKQKQQQQKPQNSLKAGSSLKEAG